jgi:hypothetical protein
MKQSPTITDLPKRNEGESDNDYERRIAKFLSGDDVRSKHDNKEWTGSLPFHINNEK